MGWTNEETQVADKKKKENSSKILLGIIACVVFIIILLIVMILIIQMNVTTLIIDGEEKVDYDITKLISDINGVTYINIEEFSKLIGYEFHKGEYKSFSNEEDKCYVTGKYETATFYLNEDKINKLPIDSGLNDVYRENLVKNPVEMINNKLYATKEAIEVAFNVSISKKEESLTIITLEHLVKFDNGNAIKWGYTDITSQTFENKKALLYDRLIVKKEDGMFKIINRDNTKEIVPDKYSDIQFSESEQEFWVTNSSNKVGILDLNGKIKIEPIYDSISILDKKQNLYIVEKNQKFGILESGKKEIIEPQYDEIGCNIESVEIKGNNKNVNPVITIEECDGIVVKQGEKYGVIDLKNNIIVPFQVDSIYSIENDEEELEYFMIYNGEELNILAMLIEQGIIKDPKKEEVVADNSNTIVQNTVIQNNTNTIENENNTNININNIENNNTNTILENEV